MQNGKGSKPRPIKNIKQFLNNWDEINWKSSKQKEITARTKDIKNIDVPEKSL